MEEELLHKKSDDHRSDIESQRFVIVFFCVAVMMVFVCVCFVCATD